MENVWTMQEGERGGIEALLGLCVVVGELARVVWGVWGLCGGCGGLYMGRVGAEDASAGL